MKQIFTLLLFVIGSLTTFADDFTYDFSNGMAAGWTASADPFGVETSDPARGTQFTSSTTLTLDNVKGVTKVVVTCSSNIADKNSVALTIGGNDWGTMTFAKESNVEKTFSGNAADGSIVVNLTRSEKSIWIKKIVVTADASSSTGGNEGTGDSKELDESYNYEEPTTIGISGETCSNTYYSFIQNNIKVTTSAGAQNDTYFGCNAGNTITFTATKPIIGLAINGYVKKDFEAESDGGYIDYVDASEDAVEADPVLVIYSINSKSVTISCDKQLRCYNVDFYFEGNPDVEIEDGGDDWGDEDLTFDYEPTTPTNLSITFEAMEYEDLSEDYGYDITDMYFYADEFEMELAAFAPSVPMTAIAPGTYEINNTYADNTVQASPGGDYFYDYPSYIATDFTYDEDYGWGYESAYYLESGTMTIERTNTGMKMTLNAKTHYGSTVKAIFEGTPENDADTDGISLPAYTTSRSNGKSIENGKVVIRKDGKTYIANGLRLVK